MNQDSPGGEYFPAKKTLSTGGGEESVGGSVGGAVPGGHAAVPVDVERLVHRYSGELYRYAWRLAGQGPDAEDLVQQVFLKVHASPGCLAGVQNERSWLYAVLRNTYLKQVRRRGPLNWTDVELAAESLPDDVPDELPVDEEKLRAALDSLSPEFRLPLLMFYFEDLSYQEIAQALDVPPGTVMSRLSRAKRHLRSRLFEPSLRLH